MYKVYVLVRESLSEQISDRKVRVYGNRLDAVEVMKTEFQAELEDWNSNHDSDTFDSETDDNDDGCAIYELGRYLETHIEWKIEECPIL